MDSSDSERISQMLATFNDIREDLFTVLPQIDPSRAKHGAEPFPIVAMDEECSRLSRFLGMTYFDKPLADVTETVSPGGNGDSVEHTSRNGDRFFLVRVRECLFRGLLARM
jgi:hypothetical protein